MRTISPPMPTRNKSKYGSSAANTPTVKVTDFAPTSSPTSATATPKSSSRSLRRKSSRSSLISQDSNQTTPKALGGNDLEGRNTKGSGRAKLNVSPQELLKKAVDAQMLHSARERLRLCRDQLQTVGLPAFQQHPHTFLSGDVIRYHRRDKKDCVVAEVKAGVVRITQMLNRPPTAQAVGDTKPIDATNKLVTESASNTEKTLAAIPPVSSPEEVSMYVLAAVFFAHCRTSSECELS